MANRIVDLETAEQLIAQGKAAIIPFTGALTSVTAVTATSGFVNQNIGWNNIGTTLGTSYVGFPLPPGTDPLRLVSVIVYAGFGGWLCNLYHVGTVNLAATGDQFTRDSWTAPLTRKVMGVASTPIYCGAVVQTRASMATTAAAFRLRTAAGGAGYTNQDGTAVVGTKTITAPGVTTAIGTVFTLMPEDGDAGFRDISAIEVTTATGAAVVGDVYLMERLATIGSDMSVPISVHDKLVGGLELPDLRPAVPTTGSVTTGLVATSFTNGAATLQGALVAVADTV